MKKEMMVMTGVRVLMGAALMLTLGWSSGLSPTAYAAPKEKENKVTTKETGFYCNINALTGEERARHHILTEKLVAKRAQIVETDKGYELQYNPADVSVAEVAEWVTMESKCCPFFDFHIDLEKEGRMVCLRLTGREGVKAFIKAEFHLG